MRTVPSSCWKFSIIAIHVRPTARPDPFERVNESHLAPGCRSIAYVRTPCLKVAEITAGGNLPIRVLAGQPDFKVVAFACAETHVSGGMNHNTIGQAESFQNFFGIRRQLIELVIRFVRSTEPDQFAFMKLMRLGILREHLCRMNPPHSESTG